MSTEERRSGEDADDAAAAAAAEERRGLARLIARVSADDERITDRIAHQWAAIRAERRAEPEPPVVVAAGPSNFRPAQVPHGVDLAAAWAWRFLVICAAGYLILRVLDFFMVIVLPVAVALLITALVSPVVRWMKRTGLPAGIGAFLVVLAGLVLVGTLLSLAGQQVAADASNLGDQVVQGLGEIKDWLKTGPLNASDSQINDYIERAQTAISERTADGGALTQVTEVGTAVGHIVAGFFIVLFSTYFFLADGARIWAWCVRLAPRAAREHVDTSGKVAWVSVTQFVRATVLVAATDALGVMVVAAILGVPFVFAIGVLVFLGAFVPMIGATIAGTVAVLVALVDQGPFVALLMLGGVILVQQIEGHVLQPFLMGRFVSVHPLGVIIAIGCGVLLAGIAGALLAVPFAAAGNAVVQHLASRTSVGEDDPDEALEEDIEDEDADVPPVPDPDSDPDDDRHRHPDPEASKDAP
ncbi:AI-2E family transporter [Nocardioides taihuensis]|uniref:AI-2E family transporter n=1 Tax=Nocardioides taihuensis TaxID=1835606 RepID=A0ABW0BJ28_9ACTN